jgi:hypothetical protein
MITLTLILVPLALPLIAWIFAGALPAPSTEIALFASLCALTVILALEMRRRAERMRHADGKLRVASVMYCDEIERRLLRSGVIVLCVVVVTYVSLRSVQTYVSQENLLLLTAPIALCALSVLRLRVMRASVMNGTFGYTRAEAKALITFIIRNADRIQDEDGGIGMRPKTRAVSAAGARSNDMPWDEHAEPAPNHDV